MLNSCKNSQCNAHNAIQQSILIIRSVTAQRASERQQLKRTCLSQRIVYFMHYKSTLYWAARLERRRPYILPQLFLFSFLFRQLPSDFTEQNSTKTCRMLGSKPDFKKNVQNLAVPRPKNWGPKLPFYGV